MPTWLWGDIPAAPPISEATRQRITEQLDALLARASSPQEGHQ